MRYERATHGQSYSFAGQKAGLLHPGGELSIVEPVLPGHATFVWSTCASASDNIEIIWFLYFSEATMHSTEDRLLHTLKSRGPLPTQAVARQLGITLPGARKHLLALSESGLVASEMVPTGVGRPKRIWTLTERAQSRFPDTHNFLTVELIGAARATFGEAGLNRLISRHGQNTLERYRAALGKRRGLRAKISKLSELRSEEGYLAEWQVLEDGTFLLSENNCPICAAATACQGFCRSELDVFKAVLGPGVKIDRIDHIVSGARRCAYRIANTQ